MFIIKDNSTMMAVSKGDSGYFTVTITGDVPPNGTEAIFTIKRKLDGQASLIKHLSLVDGEVLIELSSQDTNKLDPGKYFWDLRIIISETEVATPVPPSLFQVLGVVGDV